MIMINNKLIILIANISFITYCSKCLNTIDNFVFITYLLLFIIKTLYLLSRLSIINIRYINKNILKINVISNLAFILIITYYYINEHDHQYSQKAFFIWEWSIQIIFLLIFIEEKQMFD